MTIIEKAGILSIASQLQNILDTLRDSGNLFYQANGISFETKWFPPIYVLSITHHLSVTELAKEIGLSHPAAILLFKEIEKNGLITSVKDLNDERKRNLMLSLKGREMVSKLKPYWEIIRSTLSEITANPNNLSLALKETEDRLQEKPLLERLNEKANNLSSQVLSEQFKIIDCTAKLTVDLAKSIERETAKELKLSQTTENNTLRYILASINGLPAGSIAFKVENAKVELRHIGVLEHYRNKGIAKRMVAYLAEKNPTINVRCKSSHQLLFNNLGFSLTHVTEDQKKAGFVEMKRISQD